MKGFLCPEEIEVIEGILAKGFEVENIEGKGKVLELILIREIPLSKECSKVETVVAYFEIKEGRFKTDFLNYTKEIHTNDGRVKTLEEKDFRNFKELFEELERKEMPVPA